jgi:putative NADH-flavin reductase
MRVRPLLKRHDPPDSWTVPRARRSRPVITCAPWRDPLRWCSQIRIEKIRGDALKAQDVEAALIGVGVVIQTLGVGLGDLFRPVHLFSDATRVLIAAMRTQGVKRLICVTGFGAGESRERKWQP